MRKLLLYHAMLLLLPFAAHGQAWIWKRMLKVDYSAGYSDPNIMSNMIVDKAGNTYALFADSSFFYVGKDSIGIGDLALVKISPAGKLVWKAPIHISNSNSRITTTEIENGLLFVKGAISFTPNGDILLCNDLPGDLHFGNNVLKEVGGFIDISHTVNQIFLAECDTSGVWLQANAIGSAINLDIFIDGLVVDSDSNVFVNGTFNDSLHIGNTRYLAFPFDTLIGPATMFLGSFKMDGSLNWIDNFPGRDPFWAPFQTYLSRYDLDKDQNGNLYFLAIGNTYLQDTIFIYKIRRNGSVAVEKKITNKANKTSCGSYEHGVIKTDKGGNIYLAMTGFNDTINFGNGIILGSGVCLEKGFLAKYDSNLNILWGKIPEGPGQSSFESMSLDNAGNLYTMGDFSGNIRVGDSVYNLTPYPYIASFFIGKYSSNGNILQGIISPGNDYENFVSDSFGNLIVNADFESIPGAIFGCDTMNNVDGYSYIAKLDPRPPTIKIIPFCTGDSLICTSDTSLYQGWIWKFRDGTTLSGEKVAYNNPPKGGYSFGLYATNSVGCMVFIKDSFVHPAPPVSAFSIPKDSIACEYTKVVLKDISKTDTVAPGNWPQDNWSFGDGTTSNSNKTATKIYQDTGLFVIKLIYNNGFCATDTSMNIRVIPAPKPGFTVSDSSGCPPLLVKINTQASGAITHIYYYFGNGQQDTVSSPSVTYPISGNYKILQQLTGPTGCITEDSANIHVRPVFRITDKTDVADVTVDSLGNADISYAGWAGTSVYDLYRYTDSDTSTTILVAQTSLTHYSDQNVNTAVHYYTYYQLAQDSCGNITGRGRVGRTIRLTGVLDPNLNTKLVWNPYVDWTGGVKTYNVYRKNPDSSFALLSSLKDTGYTDPSFISDAVYHECYKVEAIANDTSAVSVSSVFCFGNSPQIFIPNVFTPNGDTLNDLFTPVFSGIKSWSMNIYNRWDEKVYSSASPQPSPKGEVESGWNGTFKGQPAPQGVYIYDIKATDYSGNIISKKGTVILML